MALIEFIYHDGPYLTNYRKDENGNPIPYTMTKQYKDAVLYVRKLVSEGLLDKECFTHTDAQADAKMATGTVGVVGAMVGGMRDAQKKSGLRSTHPELKSTYLGPMHYGNGQVFEQIELNGRNGSHVFIFPTTNKNLEANLAWITFMNSKEGCELMRYGFEGDTFTRNDKGQPRLLQSILDNGNSDDAAVREANSEMMRQKGVNQYVMLYADLSVDWFGEFRAGRESGMDPDAKAFIDDNVRPLHLMDGYPVDGMISTFDRREEYFNLMAGERERTAREKAYFAASDDEAISIIDEYLDYLRTGENAVLPALLEHMKNMVPTRSDWIY